MSEMSHDFPSERTESLTVGTTSIAAYLSERLLMSGKTFVCKPDVDNDVYTFELTVDDKAYAEEQLQKKHGKLVINYKGYSVRCYGQMHEGQNTWWATEDDEGIVTHGFNSWDEAVRKFIDDYEIPCVELGAV